MIAKKFIAGILVGAGLLMVDTSHAAVLVGWDFTGVNNYGPNTLAANYEANGIATGGLVRGPGVTTTGTPAANAWGGNGWSTTSSADAITAGDYFSFTLTADPGETFSLTKINAYNVVRNLDQNMFILWQYSLNGTSYIDIGTRTTLVGIGAAKAGVTLPAALQNITEVTFRAVMYFQSTPTAAMDVSFRNGTTPVEGYYFTVDGTTSAVPEPSTYALLALGGVAFVVFARRRKTLVS